MFAIIFTGLIIDSELSTFPPSTFGSQSLTEKSEPRSFLLPSLTEPSSTKKSWKSSQFITNPSEVDRLIQACTEDGSTRDLGCGPSDPCQLGAEKAESEDEAVSVSLVIGVGSSQDYKHRSGLAHFCEHMVHHGCEKFKEEDSYFKYVMTKGYEFNAYTAATLTAYYFRVQGAHLEQGLDLLSNMMAEPTFEENMCKREVQAVDNGVNMKSLKLPMNRYFN
ncbi:A-factor-processing enzyme-like [Folsomia candida]|uniref:A-factor-processing enzyme-like n=1 Tax=Folsomia candida TaxID=158441 RepID=UPI001604BA06|nr:A-factor-processing enzyme-like [Folsomia candida]